MSNNTNTNSTTIDEETIGKPYTGPRKLVWIDGKQIMQPDLEALSQGSPGAFQEQQQSSYFVGKTLDDIVSETDEKQFSKLKNDDQKYEMVKGMITGVETNPIFRVSDGYVNGDHRGLKYLLQDLLEKGKVYLNPKDGNLYEMGYALQEKMISFHCAYCSKILYNPKDKTMHEVSTHMAQRI